MKIGFEGLMLLASTTLCGLFLAGAAHTGVFKSTLPVTIPEGVTISVRLTHGIPSGGHRSGDAFEATVAVPVKIDGKEIIPVGAPARGIIVESREPGRLETSTGVELALKGVQVDGSWYDVRTAAKRLQIAAGTLQRFQLSDPVIVDVASDR